MNSPRNTRGYLELVDSMTAIEFDAEQGLFQGEYDRNRDSVSLAVVAVVATVLDKEPAHLAPLHYSIDADVLAELLADSTRTQRGASRISFTYEGFEVSVFSDGKVEAVPQANT